MNTLETIAIGNDFLNRTQVAQELKERLDKCLDKGLTKGLTNLRIRSKKEHY
jgi:hypothetical protein